MDMTPPRKSKNPSLQDLAAFQNRTDANINSLAQAVQGVSKSVATLASTIYARPAPPTRAQQYKNIAIAVALMGVLLFAATAWLDYRIYRAALAAEWTSKR